MSKTDYSLTPVKASMPDVYAGAALLVVVVEVVDVDEVVDVVEILLVVEVVVVDDLVLELDVVVVTGRLRTI